MEYSLVTSVAKEVADELSLSLTLEGEWGYVGCFTLANGKRRYFRNTYLDINASAAAEVAKDKSYAAFFMNERGYKTPVGRSFLTPTRAQELGVINDPSAPTLYANGLGYPVIVKPNGGAQGKGVSKVTTPNQLGAAISLASQRDDLFLIQEYVTGREYRVCVLDEELVLIYRRIPPAGNIVAANLAQGGSVETLDMSRLHPSWRQLAVNLAADMGLRFCGIDIITDNMPWETLRDPIILEINTAPGFYHYAALSDESMREVKEIYRHAFRKMCQME